MFALKVKLKTARSKQAPRGTKAALGMNIFIACAGKTTDLNSQIQASSFSFLRKGGPE